MDPGDEQPPEQSGHDKDTPKDHPILESDLNEILAVLHDEQRQPKGDPPTFQAQLHAWSHVFSPPPMANNDIGLAHHDLQPPDPPNPVILLAWDDTFDYDTMGRQ
ncbi:hypothetical protein FIBSPDRAFT_942683 [Athelia psychrophila]|uniref:Uncharacterized protein n=1 Tax=Athelia psychrophila TaxID=1759441 RepID=A0A166XA21_9AGAM|nr:hypothetical protein FIBSPDRAFT_942683 [Fibularhizoctonia sp. CBS 109695]